MIVIAVGVPPVAVAVVVHLYLWAQQTMLDLSIPDNIHKVRIHSKSGGSDRNWEEDPSHDLGPPLGGPNEILCCTDTSILCSCVHDGLG